MADEKAVARRLEGPDGDGFIWLTCDDPLIATNLNLGRISAEQMDLIAADWLQRRDFGEG